MATADSAQHVHPTLRQRLGVFDTTAITLTKSRAAQAAASLAYYTFFSIFPLMLLIILLGSYFLNRQDVLQRVTQAVQSALPISQQFIAENLQQVLKQRTAVGIFVLVSLLWSASNMFNNLAYHINMAWPEARRRNFLQSHLIGLDMILGLTVLLIASVALDALTKWLGGLAGPNGAMGGMNVWTIVSWLGSWIAVFLLYLAMYHWVPTVPVAWSASVWGAAAASIGWKAASTAFSWYLGSPFAQYELVYGSLGAVVAFLFLIYIIALVTLFGAHLTAAVDRLQRPPAEATRVEPASAQPEPIPATGEAPEEEDEGTAAAKAPAEELQPRADETSPEDTGDGDSP